MADLTHDEIALLCVISEYTISTLDADNRRNMDRLIAKGYVVETRDSPPFRLTEKGIVFLGDHSAG